MTPATRRRVWFWLQAGASFVLLMVAACITLLVAVTLLGGCGMVSSHRRLVAYEAVQLRCEDGIRDIVERTETTAQQDLDDLDQLHTWCNEELAAAAGGRP